VAFNKKLPFYEFICEPAQLNVELSWAGFLSQGNYLIFNSPQFKPSVNIVWQSLPLGQSKNQSSGFACDNTEW